MLKWLRDFWYTLRGGWWLHHEGKWVRIELLGKFVSVFQGKVLVFKKDFEWKFPAYINCGISSYRGWKFTPVLMDGYLPPKCVYVCLNKRIKH